MKDFAMYSSAGNAAVRRMVESVEKKMKAGTVSRSKVCELLRNGMKRIEKKHDEVYDTEVRSCIAGHFDKMFKSEGYQEISIYDDL